MHVHSNVYRSVFLNLRYLRAYSTVDLYVIGLCLGYQVDGLYWRNIDKYLNIQEA